MTRVLSVSLRGGKVYPILTQLRKYAHQLPDHDRALHHPRAKEGPPVQAGIDLHDALREHECNANDEGGPHAQADENTFGEQQARGADECFGKDIGDAGFRFFLRSVHRETGFAPDLGRAMVQDYVGADFGEEQEEEGEQSGVEDYLADEDPGSC